jgi:hypothetical protein
MKIPKCADKSTMKYLMLGLMMTSFSYLHANEPLKEVFKRLSDETIECDLPTEGYGPSQALADINNGQLVFMGRDMFPGNGQNRTCVYKSKSAYILYNNCMANKSEASATDIEVISFNGGMARFYILNDKKPISALKRSDYDVTWTVSYQETDPPGSLNMAQLKAYKERAEKASGGCFIGSVFKPQDMSTKAGCYGKVDSPGWKQEAEQFWKDPGEEWYKTKKHLRQTVIKSSF